MKKFYKNTFMFDNIKNFSTQKNISCGPASIIAIAIEKYGEKPKIIFANPADNTQTLIFFNNFYFLFT